MNNIDQWKQANDTLRDIEKELREEDIKWIRATPNTPLPREAWMLKEKRECNALIARLEKGTKEEQA